MKVTPEEIERGLRELELCDVKTRQALSSLSLLTRPEVRPRYETITAAHTRQESKEQPDAKLESDS